MTPGEQSGQSGKLKTIPCKGRGCEELCTSMSGVHLQLIVPVVAGEAGSSSSRVGMLGSIATVSITAFSETVS